MKKIILSLGMLIAVATASYAQTNTATVNQTTGDRNKAVVEQTGQLNVTTVTQIGAQTTDNTATVTQKGTGNTATVSEVGKKHVVDVMQDNLAFPSNIDQATVVISGAVSNSDTVNIKQTGKASETEVRLEGDANKVTITQSGDTNKARVAGNTAAGNDNNKVDITQTGKLGQVFAGFVGDFNIIKVVQGGDNNNIGSFAGPGPAIVDANFTKTRVGGNIIFDPAGVEPFVVQSGVQIAGDRNNVNLEQGTDTRDNTIGVNMAFAAGTNGNKVTIKQLNGAKENFAGVAVLGGMDDNMATITQTGANARMNHAGIAFYGDNDVATILQTGENNLALIVSKASTVSGKNTATIEQSGNFNQGLIEQSGVNGSTAVLSQTTNFNYGEIHQQGNGNNQAYVIQESTVAGNRFLVEQLGSGNYVNARQQSIDGIQASSVEIRQTGLNNRIGSATSAPGVIKGDQHFTQIGNGNVILP